jgi:hypothetical protein
MRSGSAEVAGLGALARHSLGSQRRQFMPIRKTSAVKTTGAKRDKDQRQAAEESKADTVSKPGGFKNDPDDPSNPNEVRERHLRKLRR